MEFLSPIVIYCFSDDGYYAIDVPPPELKGAWEIQAAAISPIHGIQMAIPQKVVRIKPFEAKFVGLPKVRNVFSFCFLK